MSEREHDDGRCCENGYFGQTHDCAKSPPTEPPAPREWWIKGHPPQTNIAGKPILFTATNEPPQNPGWTHVIEYAAFDRACADLKDALAVINSDEPNANEIRLAKENAELRAENEKHRWRMLGAQVDPTIEALQAELRAAENHITSLEVSLIDLGKERDEARAECARLRGALERVLNGKIHKKELEALLERGADE
jgi:hypothetical protein